jgi:endonuclease/exonuclease/phosphatase family metal-dependent hydrolase
MNPSNCGATKLKSVGARKGRDGALASGHGSRVVARGLTAAMLVVVATGCGTALNYLQPAAPLYQVRSDRPAQEQSSELESGASAPLRVVSFNIQFSRRIEDAIQVLREHDSVRNADILALQEMDGTGTERIAQALGMNAVYFPSAVHPKHGRDFGCALLSPWPLVEPRKLVLPHEARMSGLRRVVTGATVLRAGERIRAYSVHLATPFAVSGEGRSEQLRVLGEDAAASPDPVVIAGDFNTYGKVAELEHLGFSWLTRRLGETARVQLFGLPIKGVSIDHVVVRGFQVADGPRALGTVRDNRDASDHRPIWATVVRSPAVTPPL